VGWQAYTSARGGKRGSGPCWPTARLAVLLRAKSLEAKKKEKEKIFLLFKSAF